MRQPSKQREINFNDPDFAQKYARRHQKMTQKFGMTYARNLKFRDFQKGRIIDVGCGAGGTGIVLAQAFPKCEVLGIDLSQPLLDIARESARAVALNGRVKFEQTDVQRIPYEDDSFDVVINMNMVHLVENPVAMLNEIERILKPDGILFIADLKRSWLSIFEKEIKSSLALSEAEELIHRTNLRDGLFTSSMIWWRYEV